MIVAASNIGLGMNVTHYFDAFRWLTQDDDIVLQSKIEDKEIESPRGLAYGDYAGWVLAINSLGQRLYVDFSSDVGHGIVCIYQFDRGKIMINELEATMELYSRLAEYSDSPSHRYGLPAFSIIKKIRSSSLIELSQKVILEMMGEADLPTLHDGIVNTSLALSCIHSSANFSKPVHWKDVLDLDLVTKWA
jgi:hypothetical protein